MQALGYRAYSAKLAKQGNSGWKHYAKVADRLYEAVRLDRERKKAREIARSAWLKTKKEPK